MLTALFIYRTKPFHDESTSIADTSKSIFCYILWALLLEHCCYYTPRANLLFETYHDPLQEEFTRTAGRSCTLDEELPIEFVSTSRPHLRDILNEHQYPSGITE